MSCFRLELRQESKPKCKRCRQRKHCACGRALPREVAEIWPDGEMQLWCRCGRRYIVSDECFIPVAA